jgi:hypothetical protein
MMYLGVREFYIKMNIDGETYDPFSAETLEVYPSGSASHRDAIIHIVRERYAAPRPIEKTK